MCIFVVTIEKLVGGVLVPVVLTMTVIYCPLSELSSTVNTEELCATDRLFYENLATLETFCYDPRILPKQLYRPLLMKVPPTGGGGSSSGPCEPDTRGFVGAWYVLLFASDLGVGCENSIQCRVVFLSEQQKIRLLQPYLANLVSSWPVDRVKSNPRTRKLLQEATLASGDLWLDSVCWDTVQFYDIPPRLRYYLLRGSDELAQELPYPNRGTRFHPHSCKPCGRFNPSIPGSCKYGDDCDQCHAVHDRLKPNFLHRRRCVVSRITSFR